MCMKKRIDITLDEEVIEELDKKRKLVPRSPYINEVLKKHLKKTKK